MADAAEERSDYKVPEKVDPNALLKEADAAGDAALAEYTKKLLGETYSPADDPRRVVILELRVICEGRPDGDIVYTLDDAASIKAMKKNPFQLKEDCKYKIQLSRICILVSNRGDWFFVFVVSPLILMNPLSSFCFLCVDSCCFSRSFRFVSFRFVRFVSFRSFRFVRSFRFALR